MQQQVGTTTTSRGCCRCTHRACLTYVVATGAVGTAVAIGCMVLVPGVGEGGRMAVLLTICALWMLLICSAAVHADACGGWSAAWEATAVTPMAPVTSLPALPVLSQELGGAGEPKEREGWAGWEGRSRAASEGLELTLPPALHMLRTRPVDAAVVLHVQGLAGRGHGGLPGWTPVLPS